MWSSGEEQSIGATVCQITSSEINCPELVDLNDLARRVFDRAYELSFSVKSVNGAIVGVVRDQKRVAQGPKV